MEKLIVVKGQLESREIDLTSSKITIGRDEKRDITLPESLVSRQHATLEKQGGDWFITDDGSANGTLVNGSRISSHMLSNGDRIEIGNFVLQFVAPTVSVPVEGSEKTVLLSDSQDLPAMAAPPAAEPLAPITEPMPSIPAAAAAPAARSSAPPTSPPTEPAAPEPPQAPVKVDSTIYISDDMGPPSAEFASFASRPSEDAAESKAAAGDSGKPNVGLVIGIVAVLVLFFLIIICGVIGLFMLRGRRTAQQWHRVQPPAVTMRVLGQSPALTSASAPEANSS